MIQSSQLKSNQNEYYCVGIQIPQCKRLVFLSTDLKGQYMSDSINISTFKHVLMTTVDAKDPDLRTEYHYLSDQTKRELAVTAALELIKSDVSASYSTGGTSSKGTYALEKHLDNLSEYTEQILKALKGE